jgi:DNA-binding MarR family transcriptional regulator
MQYPDPPHVRLLNLLSAIRGLSPFETMTAEEDELLRALIVRWHDFQDISVSDITKSMTGMSSTTAYRRLCGLRQKGLIKLRSDATDKRVKFVDPTEMAREYSKQVDLVLEQLGAGTRTA